MTSKERILAIRLLEKQEHNSEYMKQIGIQVKMVDRTTESAEKRSEKGGV